MSNLSTANDAIAIELAQAKQGAEFYQSRIVALEALLQELSIIENGTPAKSATGAKRGRKPGLVTATKVTSGRRGRPPKALETSKAPVASSNKAAKKSARENELPKTGGDYWLNLVTDQPRTAVEVLDAAVTGLGYEATREQRQKLQQRMVFALNAMVKDGKIKDSGSGRGRKFYR